MDVTAIMVAKSDPHPASDDGNGMEYFVNRERNCISKKMRSPVAIIVFFLLSGLTVVAVAAAADSCVEEEEEGT